VLKKSDFSDRSDSRSKLPKITNRSKSRDKSVSHTNANSNTTKADSKDSNKESRDKEHKDRDSKDLSVGPNTKEFTDLELTGLQVNSDQSKLGKIKSANDF